MSFTRAAPVALWPFLRGRPHVRKSPVEDELRTLANLGSREPASRAGLDRKCQCCIRREEHLEPEVGGVPCRRLAALLGTDTCDEQLFHGMVPQPFLQGDSSSRLTEE